MKRYRGKLFGAALGYSFGGPIGALIGGAVGALFDASDSDRPMGKRSDAEKELAFITSLILLLVGIAKSDRAVTEKEIETIKSFFKKQLGYQKMEYFVIERLINTSLSTDINLSKACQDITRRTIYEERLFLVKLGYQVAVADGCLNAAEENFIRQASAHLGIDEYDYAMIKNSFSLQNRDYDTSTGSMEGWQGKDAFSVLGVAPNCTAEELQWAYRNLANKYHPDKVSHLGTEFVELATNKFNQIQKAYEIIKKEKSIS